MRCVHWIAAFFHFFLWMDSEAKDNRIRPDLLRRALVIFDRLVVITAFAAMAVWLDDEIRWIGRSVEVPLWWPLNFFMNEYPLLLPVLAVIVRLH